MSARFIKLDENGKQVCGLLNGTSVASFRLRLPKLSAVKLQRALPHIMSDYLSDSGADVSFCHVDLPDSDHSLVLVCQHEALEVLADEAQDNGLELKAIWPDYMQVPQPDEGVATVEQDGDILARRADGTGFRLPKALAEASFGDLSPHSVALSSAPSEAGFATGRFGTQLPLSAMMATAKRPLWLSGIAAAVWLAATLYGGISGFQKTEELAQRGEQMFRQQFPDVRRVVNVEAQLRNRLGSSGGASFSGYSGRILDSLKPVKNIRLEAIEFIGGRNQTIDITLSGRSFSDLEAGRLKLAAAGFNVEEGKSEQSKQLVSGRFTLSIAGGRR